MKRDFTTDTKNELIQLIKETQESEWVSSGWMDWVDDLLTSDVRESWQTLEEYRAKMVDKNNIAVNDIENIWGRVTNFDGVYGQRLAALGELAGIYLEKLTLIREKIRPEAIISTLQGSPDLLRFELQELTDKISLTMDNLKRKRTACEFEKLLVRDAAGNITDYNWEKLGNILEKSADGITDEQYMALIMVVDAMEANDIEKFANMAYISAEGFISRISPVFIELEKRYWDFTQNAALVTLWNPESQLDYDKKEIINQLSKAQILKLISKMEEVTPLIEIFGKHVELSSESENGLLTYKLTLTESDRNAVSSSAAFEEISKALAGENVSKLTFKIFPWGTAEFSEFNLDQYAQMTLEGMKQSSKEVAVNDLVDFMISTGIDKVDSTGLASLIAGQFKNQLDNYEKTVTIDGSINAIDAGNYINAFGISTGIIATEGFATNKMAFVSSVINEKDLMVRLEVYNQSHTDINKGQVLSGLENGGTGLEEYVDWYYKEGGSGEIEEYWGKLAQIKELYQYEQGIKPLPDVKDLSQNQIEELIKKEADPTYEIDDSIMGAN